MRGSTSQIQYGTPWLGFGADRAEQEVILVGREDRRIRLAKEAVVDGERAREREHDQAGDNRPPLAAGRPQSHEPALRSSFAAAVFDDGGSRRVAMNSSTASGTRNTRSKSPSTR